MDVIELRNMRAPGRHGANPGEREREQPFELNVRLEMDLRSAERSDDLADTVNYAEIHNRIAHIVASTSFALLERLAGEILEAVFSDVRIARAEITIAKPGLLEGTTPAVTLRRENPRCRASFP